jgi:hypothetical protein
LRPTPNLEDQVTVLMPPSDRVAQLYPQAPGSLPVAFYDSQGYSGGILTRLHTGTVYICSAELCTSTDGKNLWLNHVVYYKKYVRTNLVTF